MESKHIAAVKKPWRRSNRFEALKQMPIVNMRNNKLAAMRVDFASWGMLHRTWLGETIQLWHQTLSVETNDPLGDEDGSNGPNSTREDDCYDRDLNDQGNDSNIPPGPVDMPLIFSEVTLALRSGMCIRSVTNIY